MNPPIDIPQAAAELLHLIARIEAGEEFVIARAGRPVARLVGPEATELQRVASPRTGRRPRRKPGGAEGQIWIGPDFDAPMPTDLA